MASFRKELVADVQLPLGADAHECFDIPLLERTEHVVDFLHGSLLRRDAHHGSLQSHPVPLHRQSRAAWTETTRSPGGKIVEEVRGRRTAGGASAGASIVADSDLSRGFLE